MPIEKSLTCAALCSALALSGCLYNRYQTNSNPSSTEQLLLAESVERAVSKLEFPELEGRAVALEVSAVTPQPQHSAYLRTVLEARLGKEGARVVPRESAELILTALVGGIGTTYETASIGIPSIPIPPTGSTPEIPFVSRMRQRGWTRVRLLTWDRTGRLLAASPTVTDRARFDVTSVLFLEFRSNDVYPGEARTLSLD